MTQTNLVKRNNPAPISGEIASCSRCKLTQCLKRTNTTGCLTLTKQGKTSWVTFSIYKLDPEEKAHQWESFNKEVLELEHSLP